MAKKQRVVKGFTFRYPKGNLDCRIVPNVEWAQSNAAFASDRNYSHIELPKDWERAYRQGFRIVSAALSSLSSHGSWKRYRHEEVEKVA